MAIIVPKGRERWPEHEPPFCVEYIDREAGSVVSKVYFANAAGAVAFADKHTTWGGALCDVESRDMPVTHEVRSLSLRVDYTLSVRRFGDVESARAEFERGKAHAQENGGRYVLAQVGVVTPLETFSHSVE
jgi:hypothetical protein